METLDYDKSHWKQTPCPKVDCRKDACKCGLENVFLSAALGDDSEESPVAPKKGNYCNAIVVYEANGHIYLYSKEGIPTLITTGGDYDEVIEEIQERLGQVENGLSQEIIDRIAGDRTLQDEIDAIKNSPDVVDVVATYAALQAYDTSGLGDNDIVRVLQDEQHEGASTYYRWNKQSNTWTYIGEVGDYYTKGQVDDLLDDKQDTLTAGENITIENNVISASGGGGSVTTLTSADFNYPVNNPDGIAMWLLPDGDYVTSLTSGYIYPDNASSKMLFRYFSKVTSGNSAIAYYVDSDNAWKYWNTNKNTGARISYGRMAPRVQQSSGTSQTDVMSQDATTKLVDGRVKQNAGAPTTSTVGTVGQLYEDTTNGKLYQCTAVSGSSYTWAEVGAGGGGGGDTVYSTKTTSDRADGGAVYIGNLDANQDEQPDPTTNDYHYRYFWALPYTNNQIPQQRSINIFGQNEGMNSISLGVNAIARLDNQVAIGAQTLNNYSATQGVALGYGAWSQAASAVALGANARATRAGEVNVGNRSGEGFNNTDYRVIGGVHDGQDAHDAATLAQGNTLATSAPTASTVGVLGQLYTDTTNMHTYQCTAISGDTYTWTQRW